MMKMSRMSLLCLSSLLLATTVTMAQEESADVEVAAHELFTSIMSPYCPGSLLNECPSSQAAVLREDIRQQLRDGVPREQIEAWLVATYGDQILASPPFTGFGVLSWLGAVAIFLGGLGAAGTWLKGRRGDTEPAAAPVADTDPLRQRMRREIAADDEI